MREREREIWTEVENKLMRKGIEKVIDTKRDDR